MEECAIAQDIDDYICTNICRVTTNAWENMSIMYKDYRNCDDEENCEMSDFISINAN